MSRDAVASLVIQSVLVVEGGVKDVGDGMGITRYGQTDAWRAEYHLPIPKNPAEAEANYRNWLDQTNLIALCDVSDALAHIVINFAVHAHARTAIKALQRIVGATSDGVLGPKTEAALARMNRTKLALRMVSAQTRYGGRDIEQHREKAKFAAGWGNRWADSMDLIAEEIV